MAKDISGLKREVKRAKLFEIQRLVRRIRQLANKKGTEAQLNKNQRKVERFKKELEFLKDAAVAEIVRRITSKDGDDEYQVIEEGVEDSQSDIDLQKRAVDKIMNSTKLKKFLERVSAAKEDSSLAEKRSSDVKTPRLKKKQQKNEKQKATTTKRKPQPKEEDEEDRSSNAEVQIPQKQQKATKGKATMSNSLVSDIKPELKEDEDYAFLPSSEFSDSDVEEDIDDISSPELKRRGLESCFVQTMSGLKEEGKEKGKEVNKKGKKNRKGQRARQQMWEKVHGKTAKHLSKNKTELSSKEGRESKTRKNIKTQHSHKQKSDDETLHPSWEATKRRRLQETMKVEFKGQKIKFDDSE
ncbi:hypothetical protein OS493_021810 [Desmophyllum pertusum]|uniref:Serum response factor-binding protein 1 n=1 Tax=Desmophyllum pertusum TaxID=174260 RepID=A0A9W9ZQZ1_9CNID|nr:hypothetical protein OS493_021810 [Desmophyllum pertusum]